MTEEKKSFYLIDGSSYIYRAFYAIGRLSNAKGMPTQAIYGFAQMLLKVIRERKPDYICVVFDAPGPNFRHEMYEAYKATRQKMPEDLIVQVPYIKNLVRFHGIPQMEMLGYEADDLIATLAHWGRDQGLEVVIVSGDKDLHQLIESPFIRQWDTQKDRVFTEDEVKEKFGVEPRRMGDYLALVGDSSDNVPGVKGVGDKTAQKLLQQWETLDGLYAHLEEVSPPSVRKKLQENRELAYLSRQLVSFKEDVPLSREIDSFVAGEPMKSELFKLYEELDFKNLLETLRQSWEDFQEVSSNTAGEGTESLRRDKIIRDEKDLFRLMEEIKALDCFSIDLETTSRDPMRAELVGVALSHADHHACYIPLNHSGKEAGNQLSEKVVLKALASVLSGEKPGKVGQNIKYEWVVFKRHGIDLKGIVFDTMVASYLLDPGKHSHSLDRIAAEHLGENMISYQEVTGKGKSQIGFAEVSVDVAAEYACEDAETTWRLVPILKRKLKEEGFEDLYVSLELPLIEVLARMEYQGILVDVQKLETLSVDFEKALDREAAIIYDLAKEEFNIQSPKQLAYILFEKLGLRVVKKTKTGPSTDVNVLEELAGEHPVVEHILNYRTLAKLKGTYADSLIKLVHPETGRIHTSYNQTVTATGRLSSSDPNLQNIPIRTEEGRKIREAFVAPPGHVLFSADYSQIELRILAHYSQDEHLVEAFHAGADIHRRTAAEMFNIPPHEVTPEMRRQAKTINFGIIYGMGAFGLARRLGISNKLAKASIDRYFDRYRGVKRYIERLIEETRQRGYCETLLGRRRSIPELQSRNYTLRQQGERLAINTPIQGTAADLIKKAMIDIHGALEKSGFKAKMLLQVHDELVFEVPMKELDVVRNLIREKMENVWELRVPLKVDMGWGENWTLAHP
jgi:DNA polymerase-1